MYHPELIAFSIVSILIVFSIVAVNHVLFIFQRMETTVQEKLEKVVELSQFHDIQEQLMAINSRYKEEKRLLYKERVALQEEILELKKKLGISKTDKQTKELH